MLQNILKHEGKKDSCRTIAYFLNKINLQDETDTLKRDLLLKDLSYKISKLSALDRALVMAEIWYNFLPNELRFLFSSTSLGIGEYDILMGLRKDKKDVGIITVLDCELEGVLRALNKDPRSKENFKNGGFKYWYYENLNRIDNTPLSIVITLVGEQRNIPCTIAVNNLLGNFDVKLLLLIGIAAGPKNKVKLGDVVCAEHIYDYEHVRLELRRFFGINTIFKRSLYRPKYINSSKNIISDIAQYNGDYLLNYYQNNIEFNKTIKMPSNISTNFKPMLHKGTIAAGEKLIADGSLYKMYRRFDQEIRAADQEDSGFSQAANYKNIDWCIFRGICDYADPNKGKEWQNLAAYTAACAGISFLKDIWSG